MNMYIRKSRLEIINCLRDPLYKNSLYLMLTSVVSSGLGFLFWVIAAKLYTPEDVGIATGLISCMSLIILVSRFGLDYSIIRFFPIGDKSKIISTSIYLTTLFVIFFGLIFVIKIDRFSDNLTLIKETSNAVIFIVTIVANSITTVFGFSFIANREGGYYFLQNLIVGLRLLFIVPLVYLGAIGIFGAVGISYLIAVAISFLAINKSGINLKPKIDKKFLKDAYHFSLGNYLANIFQTAPNQIIPLLILSIFGPKETAYYYIAFSIFSLIMMIPNSISMSLFVEGSYGETLKKSVIKSLTLIILITIPTVFAVYVSAGWLLEIIGKGYSLNGLNLLRVMLFATIFLPANYIYFSIKRIQNDIKGLAYLNGLIFLVVIVVGYFLMRAYGLIGIGYAWIISYAIGSLFVVITGYKEKWF